MQKENKMGVMPINKLIISMSLPMIISMLVQALYNIVDSIFVSQINEQALTAVSLAFPMQSLMIAVGSGTGVGINALLSRSLGEKDYDRADAAANNGLLLMVFSWLFFVLLGLFAAGPFFRTQTQNGTIIDGRKQMKTQAKYNIQMNYIQDRDIVEDTREQALGLNCPNCGAPLSTLGAKICAYCDSPLVEFNIKTWTFSDVEEVK